MIEIKFDTFISQIDTNDLIEIGDLIEDILEKCNIWIYDTEKFVTDDNKILGKDLQYREKISDYNIKSIEVYKRLRDSEGKVLPNELVDNYIQYRKEKDEEQYVQNTSHFLNLLNRYINTVTQTATNTAINTTTTNTTTTETNDEPDNANLINRHYTITLSNGTAVHTSIQYYNIPSQNLINTLYNTLLSVNPLFDDDGDDELYPEDVKIVCKEEELMQLPLLKLEELQNKPYYKSTTCHICLDDYTDADEILLLKCEHYFHKDCVSTWLTKESVKCPICKKKSFEGKPL